MDVGVVVVGVDGHAEHLDVGLVVVGVDMDEGHIDLGPVVTVMVVGVHMHEGQVDLGVIVAVAGVVIPAARRGVGLRPSLVGLSSRFIRLTPSLVRFSFGLVLVGVRPAAVLAIAARSDSA